MSVCASMNCYAKRSRIIRLAVVCAMVLATGALTPQPLAAAEVQALFVLAADLDQPSDVAVGDDGTAYVLDGVNGRVVVFDTEGRRRFAFYGEGKGRLNLPMGIATGGERLYVADSGNHRIVVFDLRGHFLHAIPLSGESPPEPVALKVLDGMLIWADRRNHRLCRHDLRNGTPLSCWGEYGEGKGEFRYPFQIDADRDGYLYVVDVLNSRVQAFHRKGRYFTRIARFGLAPGELYRPNGLAIARDGRLFVGDSYRGTVSVFLAGRFQGLLSERSGAPIRLGTPVGVSVWRDRLYVVDAGDSRVVVYRLSPAVETSRSITGKIVTSQKNCATCHLSWAAGYVSGEGVQDGIAPVATPQMCYSCHHGVIIDSRRAIGRGEQHPDIHHRRKEKKEKTERDEIPKEFPLVGDKQLSCGSCHTPHGVDPERPVTRKSDDTNPWMRVLNRKGSLCHRCHESKLDSALDKKRPRRGINHPVGIVLTPPPYPNAKGYATDKKLQRGLPDELAERGAQLGPQRQLICQSCHRVHGAASEALLPFARDDSRLCKACHQRHYARDRDEARRKGIHPVDIKLDQAVHMGDEKIERITCFTCHSLHGGEPGTPLLKFNHREGRLCSFCHDGYDAVANSDHDLRITARDYRDRFHQLPKQGGVCGTCHTMHRGDGQAPFLYAGEFQPWQGDEPALRRDELCLDCHREKKVAEKAIVEHFSHPYKDLVLRSNPQSMPLVDESGEIDEFGVIACITCHDPHRWTADKSQIPSSIAENQDGNALNSFLRRKGIKQTFCVECHGMETLVKYKYYHDKLSRDAGVNYLE